MATRYGSVCNNLTSAICVPFASSRTRTHIHQFGREKWEPRRNGQIEINYVHRVENICLIIVRVAHKACATWHKNSVISMHQFLRAVAAALQTIFLLVVQLHAAETDSILI